MQMDLMSHTSQTVISFNHVPPLMGTLDSKYGKFVGLFAAVLFIITAFVMLLMKGDGQEWTIALTVSGVFALIAGILMVMGESSKKIDGMAVLLLGIVAALAYVLIKIVEMDAYIVVGIVAAIGALTILVGCLVDKGRKNVIMMYVDIFFLIIELILVALIFMQTSLDISQASAVIVVGFWLAVYLVMGADGETEENPIDPNRKSAKKAQKQRSKQEAQARKEKERQDKLEARKKSEKKHKHEEHKKEVAEVKEEPKAEEPVEEGPVEEPVEEEVPVKEEPKEQIKAAPVEELAKEEPAAEPEPVKEEPKSEPEPVKEEAKPEPEPVKEEPAAEPEPAKEEPKKEEPKKINNDFMSRLVSSKDVGGRIVPPKKEPEPEPVVEEAPVKEEPVAEPEPVKEEPVVEPEPVIEEPAVEPEPEPVKEEVEPEPVQVAEPEPVEDTVEEPVAEPEPEPVVEEAPVKEEPVAEPEPVKEEAVAAAAVAAASETEEEPDEELSEEEMEDIYTDYSPEALVRRAAWNKGMRCRRNYGEYNIPVAFVKGKVAVYVEEPGSENPEVEAKLKEDGWVVLRYDINKITDGLAEGAEIADTIKANMRAQKAAKKKKKPAKK